MVFLSDSGPMLVTLGSCQDVGEGGLSLRGVDVIAEPP